MVTAQIAVAIAIIVQRQTFAAESALVSIKAESTTWIETLLFGENIGFLKALRTFIQNWIATLHCGDVAFDPKTFFKGRLNDYVKICVLATFRTHQGQLRSRCHFE